jgi:hypothetical protein
MRWSELEQDLVIENRMVWKKRGNKVVRAVRCTSGPRKGRTVSTSSQCNKAIDQKKRLNMKRTKATKGRRMARKANKTKRLNPASRMVRTLNKK